MSNDPDDFHYEWVYLLQKRELHFIFVFSEEIFENLPLFKYDTVKYYQHYLHSQPIEH